LCQNACCVHAHINVVFEIALHIQEHALAHRRVDGFTSVPCRRGKRGTDKFIVARGAGAETTCHSTDRGVFDDSASQILAVLSDFQRSATSYLLYRQVFS
jgi:hypothetical protein